jgi:hypothetical protein
VNTTNSCLYSCYVRTARPRVFTRMLDLDSLVNSNTPAGHARTTTIQMRDAALTEKAAVPRNTWNDASVECARPSFEMSPALLATT